VHVDANLFSVSSESISTAADAALIAITYGYSRDHREDLKQWMLVLATMHDGDIPLLPII
jgi:transposase